METDVCGGENSCTMYSTKRGRREEKSRWLLPRRNMETATEVARGTTRKRAGHEQDGTALRMRVHLGEGKVPTNMSGENAVPKRT